MSARDPHAPPPLPSSGDTPRAGQRPLKNTSAQPPLPVAPDDSSPIFSEDSADAPALAPARRVPPAGRKFPCRNCGARLDFDPTSRSLKCPYCGFEEEIKPSSKEVAEQDWDTYWEHQHSEETVLPERSSEVTCNSCGAVVLLDDKLATDKCPYCAAHLENQPEAARAMIPVRGILPFSVTSRTAIERFNTWISSLWFAPSQLRQLANLGQLSGMYLPYWTYDSMTYTHYTGQRGDNYTVTETYVENETYTETNAQGQTITQTRPVTKTRNVVKIHWSYASGEVDQFFDDVLVCASRSLPDNLIQQLEPWDVRRLEEFRPEFLSGYQTERYAISLRDGFTTAQSIMDGEIRSLCCRDIGGDHQTLNTVKTQHVGITFKHVLFPVWIAPFRYKNDLYRIVVNARTGEVVGTRPYSFAKIITLILIIVAVVVLIVVIANQ